MTLCLGPVRDCPECGDQLIHQMNRGPHESSSAFGQYMHDRGEKDQRWRQMYWMDVDGAIYKKSTQVLRFVEHKPPSGVLSAGQREVLPLLAKAVQLLVGTGLIHRQSGVFVLRSEHPHETICVEQVKGWPLGETWLPPTTLTGRKAEDFLRGDVIDESPREQAA